MRTTHEAASAILHIEVAVLSALDSLIYEAEEWYLPTIRIADEAGIPREYARIALRRLVDQGYAKFSRGLFTEDGDVAGAGYSITDAGRHCANRNRGIMTLRLRKPRKYRIGHDSGEVFETDVEFDGYTITIELLDKEEADLLEAGLIADHGQPMEDTI